MKKPELEPRCATRLAPGGLLQLRCDVPLDVDGQDLEGSRGSDPAQPSAPGTFEPRQSGRFRYGRLDPSHIQQVIMNLFATAGQVMETRASGTDALELFRNDPQRFDIVVTDMTMPQMTGDELTKGILSIRPDIPTVLCTGYSKRMSDMKAKEIGISAFVMKPLTQHELASTVRRVLDENPQK